MYPAIILVPDMLERQSKL